MMRSWVEVSLDRIAANYRAVKEAVGAGVTVMPVVKADAYRHGAAAVSHRLEQEGVRWFAVSNVEEGIRLREQGVRARILVMADTVAAGREAWQIYRLTPAVHSLEEIQQLPPGVSYHLKIDTGMGRLGVRASTEEIVRAARGTAIEGLMTHFASSADHTSAQTQEQISAFEEIARELPVEYLHQSSTNSVHFGTRGAWGNLVRPGLALYGYVSRGKGPAPARLLEVSPALSWRTRILLVKEIEAGARIGYGGLYVAPRAMRIGILAAGYADGLPHRLSNKGEVLAGGKRAAILGAVSMDVTTVDLSGTPELKAGDTATLLGQEGDESLDAQQLARQAGTIAYALLCGISARVKQVFV
jgi:alanine racemase